MTKTFKKSVAFLSATVMVMAMLLYFPSGMFSNIDWGLKASAATIKTSKPTEGDGSSDKPYEIDSKEELYWFAALVNGDASVCTGEVSQNKSACAVLTADITVNSGLEGKKGLLDSLKYDSFGDVYGNDFTSWTPIGNKDNQYTGTFDGRGHTISGLYFNNSAETYVGLFGHVGANGSVSNVGVVDSYFKGSTYVGGVCGRNNANSDGTATIENCYNTGNVSGTNHVGGVCGYNFATSETATAKITNCYNTGNVSGSSNVGGGTCYNVGGVCGYNGASSNGTATIENCYNTGTVDGSVRGSGNCVGGVCGYNGASSNGTATITNCYNTGTVRGSVDVGGVCGKNYAYDATATITNCYYDSTVYNNGTAVGTNTNGTVSKNVQGKTSEQFNSGEVAYLLSQDGDAWGQDLSVKNSYPVLDSTKKVYQNESYSGCESNPGDLAYSYSNTQDDPVYAAHSYSNGICKSCNGYQSATDSNSDGYLEISNAGQLYWFAALVNGTLTDGTPQNTAANAVLTDNITVNSGLEGKNGLLDSLIYDETTGEVTNSTDFTNWTPIGNDSNKYTGTFDGQNHTISGLYFNDKTTEKVGLFGYCYNGTIKNVGVVDSYFKGNKKVGGVCGYNSGEITNCYNTGAVSGTEYVGGVCGWNNPPSDGTATITNCYNTGAVSGSSNVGGVCGYNSGEITNCYNTVAVSGSSNVGGVCGTNGVATITNCYYDSIVYGGKACGVNNGNVENVEGKATKQFASGEVCYLLNGSTSEDTLVWGQTIGTDNYPVLDSTKKVYRNASYSGCCEEHKGNVTYAYANESAEPTYAEHNSYNENGFCDLCGKGYEPANKTTDKYDINGDNIKDTVYEISNAGQLYWFAGLVNGDANVCKDGVTQNASANAVLTANITVNKGDVENAVANCNGKKATGWIDWTPIGNNDNQYTGTFDGNGKTISGLYFSNPDTSYVGLFGCSKGTIKNIGVVDSYFEGKYLVGGVCGKNQNGTIENCYNKGAVSGTECVGGVCGQNLANVEKATATITNCYNTGTVSGSKYVGGVCGSNYACDGTATATIENCYNTGTVSGSNVVGGVCGQNAMGKITNCYYDRTVYHNGTAVGIDDEGTVSENVLGKTTEQFTSGEVAYLLQSGQTEVNETIPEVWGQKIGTDLYPVLDGEAVYRNESYAQCESKPGTPTYSYANTQKATVYQEHSYVNGICKWCDKPEHQHAVARYVRTNVIESTCTEYGSYTRLAYCSCGQLMTTRNFLTLPKEHDYSSGGICKNCGTLKNGRDGFKSASLTLTDGVIINYNLLLSDTALADTGAYIYFTSPQGLDVKIMLSEGVENSGKYKFSLKLRPDQMADVVTAKVVYSDGSEGNSVDYSVTKYAENQSGTADTKTLNLINAMLHYGAATQNYTGNNTDNPANGNITDTFNPNVQISDDYKMSLNGTVNGIKIKGASLIAGSLTTIKVKYQVTEGSIDDFTFTCDGVQLTPVKEGNYYYVYISDISPDNIDKMYNIVVTDKNGNSRTLEYSALTYAKSIIEDTTGKYPESLVNMMKALYYYNKAADAYSN